LSLASPTGNFVPISLASLRQISIAVLTAAVALPAASADRNDFTNLARSRYVHCAFYKNYDTDPINGDPIMIEGRADALMHFQGIDEAHETARAIYTRMAGQREVVVRHTAKAIHFIDNVAGMYLLTTVHNCLDFDDKRGICVTYGASHARLFDTAVLQDPDGVYEKIKGSAEPGFCDHSFIGIQEASHSR
jgi:hypothetical protein